MSLMKWMVRRLCVAGGPAYALSGTLVNPPKISSRIGADWKRQRFTASLVAN